MTAWNCRIFVLGLLIIQSMVYGQNYDSNPFLNGYANDVNEFISDQQKQNKIDMDSNLFLSHAVSSRAAQFSGPQYLPPVEKQQLICSGQEVCIRKNSCQNGYFTSKDLNRDSRQDCDSATEVCCSFKPPVTPSTPCNGNNYACISPNQCSNGEITIKGFTKQSSSDKCFAPEVCCRIPPPDSTVLQDDGYVLRKPENPLNVPERPRPRPKQPTYPSPNQPTQPQRPQTPRPPTYTPPRQDQTRPPVRPDKPISPPPYTPPRQDQPRPPPPSPATYLPPRPDQPRQPTQKPPTYTPPRQDQPRQPQRPDRPTPGVPDRPQRPQPSRPQRPQRPLPPPQQPSYPTPSQPSYPTPPQPSYPSPPQPTYPAPTQPARPRQPSSQGPTYLPPKQDQPRQPTQRPPTYTPPRQDQPRQPPSPRPDRPIPQKPEPSRPQKPQQPPSKQPSYPTPSQPSYPTPPQPSYPSPPQPSQPSYPNPPQPSYPNPTQPSRTPRPSYPTPPQPPTYLPPKQDQPRPTQPPRQDTYRPDVPNRGEGVLSEPIPKPQPQRPLPPIISNDINEPQVPSTCAAALNCTQIEYCSATGDISDTQVILTPDQELFRVPLTDCYNQEKGFYGKCCRDLTYTDPWPVSQLGQYQGINFGDDGSYKPEQVRRRRAKISNNNVKRGVSEANVPKIEKISISNGVSLNNKCATRNLDGTPAGIQSIDAPFSMYPWQAMVLLESTKSLLCGGIIIADDVVATAAHCVQGRKHYDVLIKGGEWKLGRDEEPLTFQLSRAKSIEIHPEYDSKTLQNDIALLHLDSKLKFEAHIGALCLNDTEPQSTDECYTTGWGKLALKVHLQDAIMHHSAVQYLSNDQCEQADETKFCGKPNVDACELDPGSALACTNGNNQYVLKGIYSSANQCGNSVILFAKPDLTWIHQSLQKNGKSLI